MTHYFKDEILKRVSEQSRGERTKANILTVASAAFRERGYDRTTTADVAQKAHVSEATVFNHFGSKSGLLLGVMRDYYQNALVELEQATRGAGGPESQLRVMVRFWLARVVRDWSLARIFSQHGRFSENPEVVAAYRELSRGLTGRVVAVLQNLQTQGSLRAEFPLFLLRDVIFGTGEHIALSSSSRPRTDKELQAAADQIVGLILNGAGPSQTAQNKDNKQSLESIDSKIDQVLALLEKQSP
jgi:AcrR family transcriptional regulator